MAGDFDSWKEANHGQLVQGYYVEDTGDDLTYYFMGGEPPLEQYILIDGVWEPLVDGFYLMDKIIDGDPEVSDPVRDPPERVPPYE